MRYFFSENMYRCKIFKAKTYKRELTHPSKFVPKKFIYFYFCYCIFAHFVIKISSSFNVISYQNIAHLYSHNKPIN